MVSELRDDFNTRWTEHAYQQLLETLRAELGEDPEFRVAETPVFLPEPLLERMVTVSEELVASLLGNRTFLEASEAVIPEAFRVREPGGIRPPHFMTVDFGFVREPNGALDIRLVELQAFPSVLGFQDYLSSAQAQAFSLSSELRWLLGDLTRESYWALLGEVLLGSHAPEEVVLLEVTPARQKTRVDFRTYEQRLGIRTVDIASVRQVGRRLEYPYEGKWLPICRIFNRAIADEMERLAVAPGFDLRGDLDVEWAGHPNWFYRASKFALPFLEHPCVPKSVFLDRFLDAPDESSLRLEHTVLKPLFSFAGRGIQFAPEMAELRSIPLAERSNYLLQQRVDFAPVVPTPEGPTLAEVRLMLVAPDGQPLRPVICMARMGRGRMMGVDYNRDQTWVGASGVFYRPKGNVGPANSL